MIARIVLGVAIGLASAAAPVYISEVAPPEIRGRLVTFFQLAVTIGIVVAYLVGLAFDSSEGWRWMLGLGAVPALCARRRHAADAAEPALAGDGGPRLRGPRGARPRSASGDPDTIEQEIVEIKGEVGAKPGTWRDLGHPVVKAALVVGVGLAILQQVSGINTVIYYAPTIIQFTGVDSSAAAILASVGVGIVNVGDDDRRDPPARPRRPPAAAADRHRGDGRSRSRRSAIVFIAGAGADARLGGRDRAA